MFLVLSRFCLITSSLTLAFFDNRFTVYGGLRMILDVQFERMGLAIGQITTVKAFLSAEDKVAEDSKRYGNLTLAKKWSIGTGSTLLFLDTHCEIVSQKCCVRGCMYTQLSAAV